MTYTHDYTWRGDLEAGADLDQASWNGKLKIGLEDPFGVLCPGVGVLSVNY